MIQKIIASWLYRVQSRLLCSVGTWHTPNCIINLINSSGHLTAKTPILYGDSAVCSQNDREKESNCVILLARSKQHLHHCMLIKYGTMIVLVVFEAIIWRTFITAYYLIFTHSNICTNLVNIKFQFSRNKKTINFYF